MERVERLFTRTLAKQVVTQLPESTETLRNYTKLSIKLADEAAFIRAIRQQEQTHCFTDAVTFDIRNEYDGKTVVYQAVLTHNIGFTVSNTMTGEELMILTLAEKSADVLGKVQHPTTATLYKIRQTGRVGHFVICKADTQQTVTMKVARKKNWGLRFCRYMQFIEDHSVTTITDTNDTKLGTIHPKLRSLGGRVTNVIFENIPETRNGEIRAVILGLAILQAIPCCHPEIYRLFDFTRNL